MPLNVGSSAYVRYEPKRSQRRTIDAAALAEKSGSKTRYQAGAVLVGLC
jgi:hypothetical protein